MSSKELPRRTKSFNSLNFMNLCKKSDRDLTEVFNTGSNNREFRDNYLIVFFGK